MAWLGTWAKRIAITIPTTYVGADLADFPVLLYLSTSSGTGSANLTSIFTEIAADANRKKIAVTTSDGVTQCYVEIAFWNNASKVAELWVRVPVVSHTATTTIYLYYDHLQADSTTYVGDTNDAVASSVWDSNYLAVYHMYDATTSTIYDSTANSLDGTKYAANEPINGVGYKTAVNSSQNFDGINDLILFGTDKWYNGVNATFTVEVFFSADTYGVGGDHRLATNGDGTVKWTISFNNAALMRFTYTTSTATIPTTTALTPTQWYHVMGTNTDPSTMALYLDGVVITGTVSTSYSVADETKLGMKTGTTYPYDGLIDEVRISKTARTVDYALATSYNLRDTLIAYGSETPMPSAGYIPSIARKMSVMGMI